MNLSTGNISSAEVHPSTNFTTQEWNLKTGFLFAHLLTGLPIHSYVLWIIITGRGIALEFFYFKLTVCEIIYCLNCLAYMLSLKFPSLNLFQWVLQALGMTSGPLFQCLMCVERYLAVVHPVIFLKYKPLRYRLMCSAVVWIIGLGFGLGRLVTFISSKNKIYICNYSVLFLVLLFIQMFCLSAVLRVLKQSGPGERGREREEENHMKKRAFNIILITTVNMVIMFVPYIVTGFHFVLTLQDVSVGWYISVFCFILSSYVQPLLYLHRVGNFSAFVHHKTCNCLRQNNE